MTYNLEDHITNIKVSYHRNGISGEGFDAIYFTLGDPGEPECNGYLVATVIPHPDDKDQLKCNGQCFVVNPADPTQCYRGDVFEPIMRKIAKAHRDDFGKRLMLKQPYGEYIDRSVSHYRNFNDVIDSLERM